jgi:hypothetical protein
MAPLLLGKNWNRVRLKRVRDVVVIGYQFLNNLKRVDVGLFEEL